MTTKSKKKAVQKEIIKSHEPKISKIKLTSIIVVSLFVIVIAAALVKEFYFDSYQKLTDDQVRSAEHVIEKVLLADGDSISNYQVSSSKRTKAIGDDKATHVIQISLCNSSIKKSYLINVDNMEIVMRSQVAYNINYFSGNSDGLCDGSFGFHSD